MIFNSMLLQNQRILVTGASSGIGRETAILLSKCGANVVITGRDVERLNITYEMLEGSGHQSEIFDLTGEDDTLDFLKLITSDNRPLSGIFHAAGVELVCAVKLSKARHFDNVFASSVKSAIALSRGAAMRGVMADCGGALIFMSSVAAQSGQTGMCVYSAAKAAIDGMVRSLAVEFASRHIRVNSIAGGGIVTEMHQRLTKGMAEDVIQAYENKHLLGFGKPIDIAQVAAFLLSAAGSWVTGATWAVDGGYLVR